MFTHTSIDWSALHAQAAQPLPQDRLSLMLNGVAVGSVAQEDAALLDAALLSGLDAAITLTDHGIDVTGSTAHLNAALAGIAQQLKQAGRLKAWRNELLPVSALPAAHDAVADFSFGAPLACLERAAARRLGILTHAVHLIGYAPNGDCWLQERAWSKATDPGLWDTLSGGLVAVGDTLLGGMLRETHEEAGLLPEQLLNVQAFGAHWVQKPVPEGVMLELSWSFSATLVAGAVPHNLDGEVSRFVCLPQSAVLAKIASGQLTLEAALALRLVWDAV